jgi:hypothetical protein
LRVFLAAAVAAAAVTAVLVPGSAGTASNRVPATTVGYHRITVDGAVLLSIAHTTSTSGGVTTITGSDMWLLGNLKKYTVTEQFDSGTEVACSRVGKASTTTEFVCTGLSQPTNQSSTLTIIAS